MGLADYVLCSEPSLYFLCFGGTSCFMLTFALMQVLISRHRFKRGVESLVETNPLAYIAPDVEKFRHSFQITLPRCGVVMPVKGVHNQSYENWRAQITSMYGGPLEFFFCVESESDPAYKHIQRLQAENSEFRIRLLVAGVSWHCSQKIHNQLYGFERAMRSCDYVIVIDDDIKLHPGTIRSWVEEMETDASVFAATGYCLDWVPPGETGLPSFFWVVWRVMASTGFYHPHDRPSNAWGGAMMFRASELRANLYGLTDAWRDGGYSEDFITLSLTRYHGRTLAVPKAAVFPNRVSGVRFGQFWNFLCRQLFVLTRTYALSAQRYMATMIYVNATVHLTIFLATVAALPLAALLASRALLGGPLLGEDDVCRPAALGLAYFCCLLLVEVSAMVGVLKTLASLCNVLSPEVTPISLSHLSFWRMLFAYLCYAPLIPAGVLTTLLSKSIVWSGVRFDVSGGRVVSMHRKDEAGRWYTVPRAESLERTFRAMAVETMKATESRR